MKTIFFAALAVIGIAAVGCIGTVSGTRTAAVPFVKDRIEGRYERSVDEVFSAAKAVITDNGWHPILAMVSRSACKPAPPVGSLAAKESTIGGGCNMH